MESSSSSKLRFLFRDHSDAEITAQSSTGSDVSLVSSELDHHDDTVLDSMTAKGIKYLCSELLELKSESNEEFHKNVFSNYTAFIRIFEESACLRNELLHLKTNISTQKGLVKEFIDVASSKSLSEEAMDLNAEECLSNETSPSTELEDHIRNMSEIFDVLFWENKIDKALDVIELEEENFQNMILEDTCSLNDLKLFESAISEMKTCLRIKLTELAENPRTSSTELQKVMLALCRLSEIHLAIQLMFKYYHTRIETGIWYLKRTRTRLGGVYVRELAKLVFTMISHAIKSFVMVCGERVSHGTELVQWAKGEIKLYIYHFNQFLDSTAQRSEGLCMAVEGVRISMSFCSLLETRRVALKPYLFKHLGPSIEEALRAHVEHLKKLIGVFSAADSWILGRYLVSGIIKEGSFSVVVGQEPEYCVLTSSARKFMMLVQTITEDVAPLFALQLDGPIFNELVNLVKEYVLVLENALLNDTDFTEDNNYSRIKQQVSILANLSALPQILPRLVTSIYRRNSQINYRPKEMDSFTVFVKEASSQLRMEYFQRYIDRIMSPKNLTPDICSVVQDDTRVAHDLMPSVTFQALFLELRKIDKLVEDTVFEKEWLVEIQRELLHVVFDWISTNKEMWITSENSTVENSLTYKQRALDVHFLAEIANYGRYFSSDPSLLTDRVETTYISIGLSLERNSIGIGHVQSWANEVIQNLLEIEKTTTLAKEVPVDIPGDETIMVGTSNQDNATTFWEDSMASDDDTIAQPELDFAAIADTSSPNAYSSPRGKSLSDDSDDSGVDIN